MFLPKAVELSTDKVVLRPLLPEHLEAFYRAGNFPEIWRWMQPNPCASLATAAEWLRLSQERYRQGEHVPFAIFDKTSQALVGSTRYCHIDRDNRGLEIGFTFVTPAFQRTYVNTHAKYCLLAHAFEQLDAIRVQFKTHEKNQASRTAIARLGAVFEGIIRNQRILPDGSLRNSALFSITRDEWPGVKQQLQARMAAPANNEELS